MRLIFNLPLLLGLTMLWAGLTASKVRLCGAVTSFVDDS